MVTLDFIVKLPKLREPLIGTIYNLILVINDDLIKLLYFLLWKEIAIVEELVYTYIRIIVTQYRTLDIIKLNRGSIFTLQF